MYFFPEKRTRKGNKEILYDLINIGLFKKKVANYHNTLRNNNQNLIFGKKYYSILIITIELLGMLYV